MGDNRMNITDMLINLGSRDDFHYTNETIIKVLKQLKAEIESLKKESEWISVGDADIYYQSGDESVDLQKKEGFIQGAKWCRNQYEMNLSKPTEGE